MGDEIGDVVVSRLCRPRDAMQSDNQNVSFTISQYATVEDLQFSVRLSICHAD